MNPITYCRRVAFGLVLDHTTKQGSETAEKHSLVLLANGALPKLMERYKGHEVSDFIVHTLKQWHEERWKEEAGSMGALLSFKEIPSLLANPNLHKLIEA